MKSATATGTAPKSGPHGTPRVIEPENMSMPQALDALCSISSNVTSGLVTIEKGEQGNSAAEARALFTGLKAACDAKDPFAAYDAAMAIQDLIHKRRIAVDSTDHGARGRATHLRRYKLRLGQFVDELNGLDTLAKVLGQVGAFANAICTGRILVSKGPSSDSSGFVRTQATALLMACKTNDGCAAQAAFANIANQTRAQKATLTQVGDDKGIAHLLDIRSGLRIRLDAFLSGSGHEEMPDMPTRATQGATATA